MRMADLDDEHDDDLDDDNDDDANEYDTYLMLPILQIWGWPDAAEI